MSRKYESDVKFDGINNFDLVDRIIQCDRRKRINFHLTEKRMASAGLKKFISHYLYKQKYTDRYG